MSSVKINMNSLLLLPALLLYINCNDATFHSEFQIIQDFLKDEDAKPILITLYTCWNQEENYYFAYKLMQENYLTSLNNLRKEYVHANKRIIHILDLNCSNADLILSQANRERLFAPTNKWLLISRRVLSNREIENMFLQFDLSLSSDVLLAEKLDDGAYSFTEIYKHSLNSTNLTTQQIAKWTRDGKFQFRKSKIVANRRKNVGGKNFGTGIVILDKNTLNHLEDYRETHIDAISKVNYFLTKYLLDYMNGTMTMYPVDSWGYLDKATNTYNGIIGLILQNITEIGGTGMFMNKERIPLVDFVSMTTPTKIRFVFRQPPLSYQQNIFTLPFSTSLWISSFILVLLAILLLYSAVSWEWHHPKLEPKANALKKSLADIIMLTLGAVAQQGTPTEPRSGAGKIIMFFTFINLMFLYVSYSANIVALLQSSATNIRTLEDLLKSRLQMGSDDTVYNRYYISNANESIKKAIYEKKIAPPGERAHFETIEEGVKMLRKGFYAFNMELGRGYKLVADTFLENEKCGLQEISFLSEVETYLTVKKNSVYKEIFRIGLRKIFENGLQSRELSKIYTKKPDCHTLGANFVSVGLIDVYAAFLFLGVGIGISIFLLILEIIVKKNLNYYKTNFKM